MFAVVRLALLDMTRSSSRKMAATVVAHRFAN
jgi:hypothetical protein